jgi:hypothetical protein
MLKHFETETFHSNWKNETPTEMELTTFIDIDGNVVRGKWKFNLQYINDPFNWVGGNSQLIKNI